MCPYGLILDTLGCMGRESLTGLATDLIAAELRAERARARLTLRELEDRTGLSRATVDRALKGESAIAVEAFVALCQALNISASGLMAAAESAVAQARTREDATVHQMPARGEWDEQQRAANEDPTVPKDEDDGLDSI